MQHHFSMYAKLALVLVCLENVSPSVSDRFKVPDSLGMAPKDLEYAFIVFRHGIRSPLANIYGSDEAFKAEWPEGMHQLTKNGRQLMEHVGRSLRTRYEHLLPDYDVDHIQVTATTSPRAIESAELVTKGMYPMPENVRKAGVDKWSPVEGKVKTFTFDYSKLFDLDETNTVCRRYTQFRDEIIKTEMTKLSRGQKKTIKKLNDQIKANKLPIEPVTTLDELLSVWDNYYMSGLDGKTVPPWAIPLMPKMEDIAQYRLWMRMHGKTDDQQSILQYYSGPLLHKVLGEAIENHKTCYATLMNPTAKKTCTHIHLHGSHDLTIATLVWAMVDRDHFIAEPGDTLIFEVNTLQQLKLYLYSPLKDAGKKFQQLSLKQLCSWKSCRLQEAVVGLQKLGLILPQKDWEEKCNSDLTLTTPNNTEWRKRKTNYLRLILEVILSILGLH